MKGKGIWINIIRECEGGDLNKITERVSEYFDHCIIKVTDYRYGYNIWDSGSGFQDLALDLARRLDERGVEVWGFNAVLPFDITQQVTRIVDRLNEIPYLKGTIIDAEMAWELDIDTNPLAEQMMRELREQTSCPIGLTTFRYIRYHEQFPWQGFKDVDFFVPQVYWEENNNPVEQIHDCINDYEAEYGFDMPLYFAFPTYKTARWNGATPQELWDAHATALLLSDGADSWWDYKHARMDVDRFWRTLKELPDFPDVEPPDPPPSQDHDHDEYALQRDMVVEVMALMEEDAKLGTAIANFNGEMAMVWNSIDINTNQVAKNQRDILAVEDELSEYKKEVNARLDIHINRIIALELGIEPIVGFWKRLKWLFTGELE